MDEAKALRTALGAFATGVTVVTAHTAAGEDIGRTANSFSSVSLSPPMVLWSLAKSSSSLAAFRDTHHFAVHVLSSLQSDLSSRFAGKMSDKFVDLDVQRGSGNTPLLRDCTARFECRTVHRYDGGDHIIFVAEVIDYVHNPAPPLVFHGGEYGRLVPHAETRLAVPREDSLVTNDMIYLVSRIFYCIRENAAAERQRLEIDGAAYAVLTTLGHLGAQTRDDLLRIASMRGNHVNAATLDRANDRGWIEMMGDRVTLTETGRGLMISIVAKLKTAEIEALSPLSADEICVLRQLLSRVALTDTAGWPPLPENTA